MFAHTFRAAARAAVVVTVVIAGLGATLQATSSAYALCRVDSCNDPPPKPTPTPRPIPSPTPAPAPTRFKLVLQQLECSSVTDQLLGFDSDDEVYYRIGGVNGAGQSVGGYDSNGQAIDRRGPTPLQGADADNLTAWDMNTSDKKWKVLYTALEDEPLAAGQTESMYLVLQESDGTNYGPLAKYGATAIGAIIGGPTATAIATALGSAIGDHLINNDDVLGDFALQVQNTGSQLVIKSVSAGPYATITYQTSNAIWVHFDHDDGVYDAVFIIQPA